VANIRELCTREVVVATRDTSVAAAAKLMRHHHVGTIVVCDQPNGGKRIPLGIVTDRDIVVEVVAPELRAETIMVGDIMGRGLVTAQETEGVLQALPIVRQDGHLVGIVSIDDLLGILAEELSEVAKIVARGQIHEAVSRK
jgi:CBS domain-containing protein